MVVQSEHVFSALLENRSSFRTVQNVVAYVLRFHNNVSGRSERQVGALSQVELQAATLALCKVVQTEVFAEEIRLVHEHKLCSKPFPFLDDKGLFELSR